jgi:hypothetical protein
MCGVFGNAIGKCDKLVINRRKIIGKGVLEWTEKHC